tara:strand:- start:193 stop:777 length:585 start_codon:yes stop_codon:yes gene_type:complete
MDILKQLLPCGYTAVPIIINGTSPSKRHNEIATRTLPLLEKDSANDKLAWNYTYEGLKLKEMSIFSVLWDFKNDQPVLVTGAQHTSNNTCRLFSRYWLFSNYRTTQSNQKFNQIDDFQVDLWHMELLKNTYPFFFWSREKGNRFFKRIKEKRPDIFKNWQVYDKNIELLWKDNWQGILYTGFDKYINELTFNSN